MASGNAGNFQSIPALKPDQVPIPTTRGSVNMYMNLDDNLNIWTVDTFKVHRAVASSSGSEWISGGNFKFSDWQTPPNITNIGEINLIPIPANMVIDAVAIRKNVQFTGGIINVAQLSFYFSTADSTPTPYIFLISNLRGSSGLGKVNFSYHSTEPVPTSAPDSESSAPNITAPYFLKGQIETNNGTIDELIGGNFDLWYKISVIPTI